MPQRLRHYLWIRGIIDGGRRRNSEGYNLVHLTLPNNFYYLAPDLKSQLLVTVHDLSHRVCPQHQTRANNVTLDIGLRNEVAEGAQFLSVSEATRRDLIQTCELESNRVTTVYSGCNQDLFYPAEDEEARRKVRRKYGIPEGAFLLGLCTIEPRKNLAATIRAFNRLVETNQGPEVTLVLAGAQGWKVKETMREARVNGDRVHFTGYVADKDLAALYSAATAFVFASHYEGFGFPLLEAMRCGAPVIYGNNSSMREIVGDSGLPVDSEDMAAIAAQMHRLLTDPILAADLGRRGRERASTFTWAKTVAETASLYSKSFA